MVALLRTESQSTVLSQDLDSCVYLAIGTTASGVVGAASGALGALAGTLRRHVGGCGVGFSCRIWSRMIEV